MQKWHGNPTISGLMGRTWHISTNVPIRPDKMGEKERRLVHVGTVHAVPVDGGFAVGVALVGDGDAFVRKIGHAIARGRALRAAVDMADPRFCNGGTLKNPRIIYLGAQRGWMDEGMFDAQTKGLRTLIDGHANVVTLRAALADLCRP